MPSKHTSINTIPIDRLRVWFEARICMVYHPPQCCRLHDQLTAFVCCQPIAGRLPPAMSNVVAPYYFLSMAPCSYSLVFQGVLDRETNVVHLFERAGRTAKATDLGQVALDDPTLPGLITNDLFEQLLEDVEMLNE